MTGLRETLRRRGEWESRTGEIVHWLVHFVCLLGGPCATILFGVWFGPSASILVTLGTLAFFLWWVSAFRGFSTGQIGCLLIMLIAAINLSVLLGTLTGLRTHDPARRAVAGYWKRPNVAGFWKQR